MAPEISRQKQKQIGKQSFDDELGDDFLSSWKPSKSIAALDFEDDEPTPKNHKASFSLGKMDTNFDFDFDGGLSALSKFNVDISDLDDLPSSRDKTVRTKDSNQGKQKGESKFSFQFNGFDELDLDDTLTTNKETEMPAHPGKGKRDLSPASTASKYGKTGLRNSFSDNASESSSAGLPESNRNEESHETLKADSAAQKRKPSGGLAFSGDDDSMQELGVLLQDKQERASRKSDYTTHERKDSAIKAGNMPVKDAVKVASSTSTDKDENEEHEGSIECGVEAPSDIESTKRFSNDLEVEANKTETVLAKLPTVEDSSAIMQNEEQTGKMEPNEVPQIEEIPEVPYTENLIMETLEEPSRIEKIGQQKSFACNADTCLAPEVDGVGNGKAIISSIHVNEPEIHTAHTEISPQASHGRAAKRKFSGEQNTSDSLVHSQKSSKKQEIHEIALKTELQQGSDSATSQRKCKDIPTPPVNNLRDTPAPGKTAPKLAADRFMKGVKGVTSLSKIPKSSPLQASRLLLVGTPGKQTKLQEQTPVVGINSPGTSLLSTTPLRNFATIKKPTVLGSLRSPPVPSTAQQKRSLCQLNSSKDLSRLTYHGKNKPVAEKQLEDQMLCKTPSVAALSKTKTAGVLREACEKDFKFDVASTKGIINHPSRHSITGIAKPENEEAEDELSPGLVEQPDAEMVDNQIKENPRKSSDEDVVHTKAEEHPWAAVSTQDDNGLRERAEDYAYRMDQLLQELKEKYEEAMDLRVRAIVVNNNLLMLNNPIEDEKIRKITQYVQEKLCLDTKGQQAVKQPS